MKKIIRRLFPEYDREAELNAEISRMSAFLTKHYTPKQRVMFLKGIRENVLADLEREKVESMEAYKDRLTDINEIKALTVPVRKKADKTNPNQTKAL